jgi:hypothetical protein
MAAVGGPLPGTFRYTLPPTVQEQLLYTMPSGEFESLTSANLTTLVFQLTDKAIIDHLQIKMDKLIIHQEKALSVVHT